MRWDDLFADLESQLEQELGAEEVDLLAEEERLRLGRLGLRERVVAMTESSRDEVRLELRGGSALALTVGSVGRDWLVGELSGARRGSCLVPLSAIAAVLPSAEQLVASLRVESTAEGAAVPVSLSARLGVAFVLRDLCRRRSAVELSTASGGRMHGTIDRVGRDHLDLAEHEPGVPRRDAAVARIRIVPFDELALVRF